MSNLAAYLTDDPLAHCGRFVAEFYSPDQPRVPAGYPAGGEWTDIGGDEQGRGAMPAYVKGEHILKGHPSLKDKPIESLSHRSQLKASREAARAAWAKLARYHGHRPEALHGLAAEYLAHDKAAVADKVTALRDARRALGEFGGAAKTIHLRIDQGKDHKSIPGFDTTAETFARQYPHLVGPNEDPEEKLWDLLIAGNPQAMSEDDAYRQALEQLDGMKQPRGRARGDSYEGGRRRKAKSAAEEEPIPFSLNGCGRLAEFGRDDQPRVPAGSPDGGEWTSGGGADPFEQFRRPEPTKRSLFGDSPTDKRPREIDQDADLRTLSAVRKRNPSVWDFPQENRSWQGGFYIMHLPTGKRITSVSGIGRHEFTVEDHRKQFLGKFRTAEEAAAFIEGPAARPVASAAAPVQPAKAGSGKVFDFSQPMAGCGQAVPTADFAAARDDQATRELSAVARRDLRAWSSPQTHPWGSAFIAHRPSGGKVEVGVDGPGYIARGRNDQHLGKFATAHEAADVIERLGRRQ